MVKKNIISLPHNISDQCNNTLFPVNIFLEAIENLTYGNDYNPEEIDTALKERLQQASERAEFLKKENEFTASDYKFIKFISRKLIHIHSGDGSEDSQKDLRFFYPYEIQLVDYETYLGNLKGKASHEEYKKRQSERARRRVLGEKLSENENKDLEVTE